MNKQLILAATAVLLACSPLHAEQMWPFSSKKKKAAKVEKTDSVKKEDKFDKAVKGARKGSGLFDYYLTKTGELLLAVTPRNLKASYLLANRISEISQNSNFVAGQMLGDPFMIRFSADTSNVYLHKVNHWERVAPNDPIEKSFRRNVQDPITRTFKIKASRNDTLLIDVTSFFVSNDKLLTPIRQSPLVPGEMSATYDAAGSKLKEVKVFEKNLEITSILNYNSEPDGYTVTVRRSILELPEEPMKVRWQDNRVGYFSSKYYTYTSSKDKLLTHEMIHRWRIEPKEGEWEKYFRGELVEPERKIVFYVDDAFPDKWREVVKQGIEDWNKAFEAAGFKNVMEARDYPDDPSFDPDDIRYNCIRYAVTDVANAMGPSYTDPRTGEILVADVIWYHNVISLVHNWRFAQTGAVDPRVRKQVFDDDVMRESIRYAAAHEIGHTLGLMHNMGASYSFPVDSLRSPSFTQKYGTTPSIMDYARNNFVAQPGDVERGVKLTPPVLGVYDIHAINWGYRIFEKTRDAEEELPLLNELLAAKRDDPMYEFGAQQIFLTLDPTDQSEDLGNDHIKAGNYGIENCKYMIANLCDWFAEENRDYKNIQSMYAAVIGQYTRYLMHVMPYLGGVEYKDLVQDGRPELHSRRAAEAGYEMAGRSGAYGACVAAAPGADGQTGPALHDPRQRGFGCRRQDFQSCDPGQHLSGRAFGPEGDLPRGHLSERRLQYGLRFGRQGRFADCRGDEFARCRRGCAAQKQRIDRPFGYGAPTGQGTGRRRKRSAGAAGRRGAASVRLQPSRMPPRPRLGRGDLLLSSRHERSVAFGAGGTAALRGDTSPGAEPLQTAPGFGRRPHAGFLRIPDPEDRIGVQECKIIVQF